MAVLDILNPTGDPARVDELLGRVGEKLGEVPAAFRAMSLSQTFLNDSIYNLKKVLAEGALDLQTKHLIAVAVASVAGSSALVESRIVEAKADGVPDDMMVEAISVAGSMSTYNTFYKFSHMAGPEYDALRPGFKVSVLIRPNVLTKLQVETIAAMVSTVNACASCVRGHTATARQLGATVEQIEEALRVAAVVVGLAAFGD